jgi:hypothetical protein
MGYWEATCDGYLTPPPPAPQGIATPGHLYEQQDGLLELSRYREPRRDEILEQALDGQANNNADCTGTITYTQTIFGQPAPDLNIRYVIWDQGDRISGLPVDAGSVLSCSLHRITKSDAP